MREGLCWQTLNFLMHRIHVPVKYIAINFSCKPSNSILKTACLLTCYFRNCIERQITVSCGSVPSLHQGFFLCSQGPNSALFPMEYRWLFSQFWKKNPNLQKNFFFFFEDWDFHSVTTHTSYMVTIYYNWILFLLHFCGGKSMCNS